MSTLVLTIAYFDDAHVHEWEFKSLNAIKIYLAGDDTDNISMIKLKDTNTDITCEGIDSIYQYIRENTGPVLPTHDLSQCGDACNCLKCNPTKSSCIALRTSELNIEVINHPMAPTPEQGDMSGLPVPVDTVTFGELEDGAEFYIAMTWAYGSRNKLQKVMEDGEHNAVWCSATHIGELIPEGIRVVRA